MPMLQKRWTECNAHELRLFKFDIYFTNPPTLVCERYYYSLMQINLFVLEKAQMMMMKTKQGPLLQLLIISLWSGVPYLQHLSCTEESDAALREKTGSRASAFQGFTLEK